MRLADDSNILMSESQLLNLSLSRERLILELVRVHTSSGLLLRDTTTNYLQLEHESNKRFSFDIMFVCN